MDLNIKVYKDMQKMDKMTFWKRYFELYFEMNEDNGKIFTFALMTNPFVVFTLWCAYHYMEE